ncbi:MAG TPA: hypothetical protein VI035_02450 [Solirubrobacterales bacterium]
MIRRITIAVLAAFLAGAVLAVPASSKSGPATVAKKKAKKCKKGKKGKKAKKRKGCKRSGSSVAGLPGEATPASPKQPNSPPPPPPDNPVLQVESLAVTPGTVQGGTTTSGQVTLDQAAPSGGQQVDLTSSVEARATVPATVVVASGQNTASFSVHTFSGNPGSTTLKASIGTGNATTVLNVVDQPSVASVRLERECFTPGTWPTNRVTLDIPAPEDTVVTLNSTSTSLELPLPTVTVPEGSTSALFGVSVDPLAPPAEATVSATTVPLTPQESDSALVNSTDPATVTDLQLDPGTVVPGESSDGTVTLGCEAPPGGTEVSLSSSDPAVVVPDSVTVAGNELSSLPFTITATGTPDGGSAIITATIGESSKTALLIVSQPI